MRNHVRVLCAAILGGVVLTASAQSPQKRGPAERTLVSGDASFEACINQIAQNFDERGGVGVRITLAYEGTPFVFTAQGIRHTSSAHQTLSLAQLAQWAPVLDLLRDAAKQKVKVQFQVDKGGDKVEAIRVKYHLPC